MKPYRSTFRASVYYCALLIFVLVTGVTPALASKRNVTKTTTLPIAVKLGSDPVTRAGFQHFYNMDYDKAIREFEIAAEQHADDPFAVNHLASGVLWKELYRIGALDSELYAKDEFLDSRHLPPDPNVRKRLKELLDRSQLLAETRLKTDPNDIDALYARGVSKGMRATYMGMVENSWFGALRSTIGARRDHERVLELDPNYNDAKFVVGVHQYVLGSVTWAVKVAASVIGLSGNKKKGIQYLYEAANANGETSVDAKIALSLFLRREQRYSDAIGLVGGLMQMFPRNYLVALEHANLLNAAGQGPEAIAAYRHLLELGRSGKFQDAKLEQAAWGLGEALRGQRDFAGAAQAYDSVVGYKHVDPELMDRSNLAAGEMYDVLNQREIAVKKYQAVISAAGQSPMAEMAKKRMKRPYQAPKG